MNYSCLLGVLLMAVAVSCQSGDPFEDLVSQLRNFTYTMSARLDARYKFTEANVVSLTTRLDQLTAQVATLANRDDSPVHFSAYRNTEYLASGTIVKYDGTWVNIGAGLNVSSGVFTAPQSGIYFFSFNGHLKASAAGMSVLLQVNGQNRAAAGHHDKVNYATTGLAVTLPLKQGDQVAVRFFGQALYDIPNHPTYGAYYGTQFNGGLLRKM